MNTESYRTDDLFPISIANILKQTVLTGHETCVANFLADSDFSGSVMLANLDTALQKMQGLMRQITPQNVKSCDGSGVVSSELVRLAYCESLGNTFELWNEVIAGNNLGDVAAAAGFTAVPPPGPSKCPQLTSNSGSTGYIPISTETTLCRTTITTVHTTHVATVTLTSTH
jgi:hypothetical protein